MCTTHSIERANERTPYSGKRAVRFIENGITRGKAADQFTQLERKYLADRSRDNNTAKAYNGFCLIVSGSGSCITLYRLPEWFGKKHYFDGKELIRNMKNRVAASCRTEEEF